MRRSRCGRRGVSAGGGAVVALRLLLVLVVPLAALAEPGGHVDRGNATMRRAAAGDAATRLVTTLLHAVATLPLPDSKAAHGPGMLQSEMVWPEWRGDARELAASLLASGRLPLLLRERTVASAMARELHGMGCELPQETEESDDDTPSPSPGESVGLPLHIGQGSDSDRMDQQKWHQPQPKAQAQRRHAEDGSHSNVQLGLCSADEDCLLGEYCDHSRTCADCSIIMWNLCNEFSGNCCGTSFLKQCPHNPVHPHAGEGPAGCCERNEDCGAGFYCVTSPWDRAENVCKEATEQELALFAAIERDPYDDTGWSVLRGWTEATSPCVGLGWTGVTCAGSSIVQLDWSGLHEIRFQLGPAVARLYDLERLLLPNTGLYGTLPAELGNLTQLEQLHVYDCRLLSGTIPLAIAGLRGSIKSLFLYGNPLVSGTIPPELGELVLLKKLYLADNPLLSGTIPPELGSLVGLNNLRLDNNAALSGTIPPLLCGLPHLFYLYLNNNGLLSGTIPRELGKMRNSLTELYLAASPMLSGTIPSELAELRSLHALDLHNDIRLTGTLPPLTNTSLVSLNIDNCSLTGLPSYLPSSISHLYMNKNPIQATADDVSRLLSSMGSSNLHAINIGFSWPLQLDGSRPGSGKGTRVYNPTTCHLGASCEFLLQMYDEDDQPATVGGLVSGLTLRFKSTLITSMRDNRDGTFTAAIPADWIPSNGTYLFQFLDQNGAEFQPKYMLNSAGQDSGRQDPDLVRTVEFLPRQCLGSHTVADDSTGATCVCKQPCTGRNFGSCFEPDETADNSTRLNCHRHCHIDESVSDDRGACVCTGRNYDTDLHGILLCFTNGFASRGLETSQAYQQAQQARVEGGRCTPCPSECTRCEGGVVTVLEGWRLNSTSTSELRTQISAGQQGRPQFVFSCPYSKEDCPEIKLTTPLASADTMRCLNHHSGPLCATCEKNYSRHGSSDNACKKCSDVSSFIDAEFGLPVAWFIMVLAALVVALGGSLYKLRSELLRFKAELKTNLRILLGSAQVLSLLPSVLELVYPAGPRSVLSFSAAIVADLRAILRTECWGWSWYDRWIASVFGMLVITVLPVVLYFAWQHFAMRRVDSDSRDELRKTAKVSSLRALAFFAMLLYPQLSSSIFSALRCERLGDGSAWLEVDYSVSCMPENGRYGNYRRVALVMVFVVPLGFPMGLLAALLRSWMQSRKEWEEARPQTALDDVSIAQFHYARVQHVFGFCIEDFRPECFYFEPVDLLRKLSLSGLLQFVHRGTAAQCFCGSFIAFVSFGLQQWLRPYREMESNVLKALVDTQLFLTFLISFILRVLPDIDSSEPFGKEVYGWMLLSSMVLLICCAIGLTFMQIHRRRRFKSQLLQLGDASSDSSADLLLFAAASNIKRDRTRAEDDVDLA